jgi:hypothetical protein
MPVTAKANLEMQAISSAINRTTFACDETARQLKDNLSATAPCSKGQTDVFI